MHGVRSQLRSGCLEQEYERHFHTWSAHLGSTWSACSAETLLSVAGAVSSLQSSIRQLLAASSPEAKNEDDRDDTDQREGQGHAKSFLDAHHHAGQGK